MKSAQHHQNKARINFKMESEGSDNEFWQEIEIDQEKITKTGMATFNSNLINVLTTQINQKLKKEPQGEKTLKEFYEEKIARIRESKDEEIRQSIIINTKNIKRDYQNSIIILKRRQKEVIDNLKAQLFSLTDTLKNRDTLISNLTKMIADSELFLTNARIIDSQSKKYLKQTNNPLNEEFYLEHISNLSTQLTSIKEVCLLYKCELDSMSSKLAEERESSKQIENSLKQEIARLKKIIKNRDFEFEARIKMFHNEFDNYKNEINLEHQAKDVVVDRQKVHIEGLRDELKNAKLILQNRKLRNKFHEKLDDYVKDSETHHRKNRSEVHSRVVSGRKEENKKLILHNRRKSDLYSPNSGVFSNKGSTHFFSFDFSLLN